MHLQVTCQFDLNRISVRQKKAVFWQQSADTVMIKCAES
jgi:hypothetical protein